MHNLISHDAASKQTKSQCIITIHKCNVINLLRMTGCKNNVQIQTGGSGSMLDLTGVEVNVTSSFRVVGAGESAMPAGASAGGAGGLDNDGAGAGVVVSLVGAAAVGAETGTSAGGEATGAVGGLAVGVIAGGDATGVTAGGGEATGVAAGGVTSGGGVDDVGGEAVGVETGDGDLVRLGGEAVGVGMVGVGFGEAAGDWAVVVVVKTRQRRARASEHLWAISIE
ncbi:hypothetical protein QQ045_025133 [Rhodiola kirilowii]